jgi:predicted NodU family carbamoyl transferase
MPEQTRANLLLKGMRVEKPVHILGVSGLYHDSAAALLRDGRIIAAAQEERFTRIKHDHQLPVHAIGYWLRCKQKRFAKDYFRQF